MVKRAFQPRFTITNAITAALTQIERARGFLEAATLSEDWVRAMSEQALVLEAHHTTHIEGTHLTLDQAQKLLAGEPVPEADPDDVRELLNYRRAFEFVSKYLDSGPPITEGLIREIHKQLVEDVRGGKAGPGQYRKVQNYVVNSATGQTIYIPPPAQDVPVLMTEMVTWLNRPGHVLEHGRLTLQQYAALYPAINRRTLQRDLRNLADRGLLSERGTSPTDPTKQYVLRERK
jgi:Fic family protein